MKCVYPCLLRFEEGFGYSVIFPDFGGGTQGKTLYEALEMAENFLGFAITSSIEDGDEIPNPTPIEKINAPLGTTLSFIRIDTEEYLNKESVRQSKEKSLNDKVVA